MTPGMPPPTEGYRWRTTDGQWREALAHLGEPFEDSRFSRVMTEDRLVGFGDHVGHLAADLTDIAFLPRSLWRAAALLYVLTPSPENEARMRALGEAARHMEACERIVKGLDGGWRQ